ncbi:MAG TPA: PAS domain-containing protein, partial [Candidatus Parabacteroides intestinavium]|nr:PAS domain-containing protein [Candidatus Parabacteroides intestinavium]
MRLKSMFFLLILLLCSLVLLLAYLVLGGLSVKLFFWIEGLMVLAIILLFVLYQRILKPLYILGNGMDLLNEQDFSSRLGRVGQKETDRIVDVFNRIMDQLKNERLRLREQNHFLDLLIQASPMGVIILNLDKQIISVNPAACKMLRIEREEVVVGNTLSDRNDLPLLEELDRVPLNDSQTIRLSDANVYKCSHSSFMDQGFSHDFYLI